MEHEPKAQPVQRPPEPTDKGEGEEQLSDEHLDQVAGGAIFKDLG